MSGERIGPQELRPADDGRPRHESLAAETLREEAEDRGTGSVAAWLLSSLVSVVALVLAAIAVTQAVREGATTPALLAGSGAAAGIAAVLRTASAYRWRSARGWAVAVGTGVLVGGGVLVLLRIILPVA